MLRSRDEVIEFFEDFHVTFPDARTASHEYLEGAHGTVVVGFRVAGTDNVGRGKSTEIWQVWEISDQENRTVTRVTEFEPTRSRQAAGLSE